MRFEFWAVCIGSIVAAILLRKIVARASQSYEQINKQIDDLLVDSQRLSTVYSKSMTLPQTAMA